MKFLLIALLMSSPFIWACSAAPKKFETVPHFYTICDNQWCMEEPC